MFCIHKYVLYQGDILSLIKLLGIALNQDKVYD